MKLLIASDIHGSAYYCEKLMQAFHTHAPDKLLLLGDLLYHGPRNDLPRDYAPKKVIAMLSDPAVRSRILCVRGNCEAEVDQMVLPFPVLADYCLLCLDGLTVFATHGHVFNETHLPPLSDGDILLQGHTHIPVCHHHAEPSTVRYTCLNPGSTSIPKENSHHGYMLYENGVFRWLDFDGNVHLTWDTRAQ